MAAYMEEVRLWLAGYIDKAPEGYKLIGDTLFYRKYVPAVQDGQSAVNITSATVRDFAAAYDISLFNPIVLAPVHRSHDGIPFQLIEHESCWTRCRKDG
jgi:K(+)-stimulated pyrophosphate-energized sodium pump